MRRLALLLPLLLTNLAAAQGRPCLMPWQRNLADALALVERTGKPLLICVNMDGETACENLAWGRYRDPDFAKLARGFVCVVASPNRHTLHDHDDAGRRILDLRFGRITSQEHIAIEPLVFERYFKNNRVAPRHVGIDKNGKELFDIFLTRGLVPIDDALKKYGKPGETTDASKLEEEDLLDSPDAKHRTRLEGWFADGDTATRARLAGTALSMKRGTQHPQIVRMALRDREKSVRHAAVRAVLAQPTAAPEFWSTAFGVAHDEAGLTAAMADAMRRVATTTKDEALGKRARRLAAICSGWNATTRLIDVPKWRAAIAGAAVVQPRADLDVDDLLDKLDERVRANPKDAAAWVQMAEATMQMAQSKRSQGRDPSLFFVDVAVAAQRAVQHGASGKAFGYLAWASFLRNDLDAALTAASSALPLLYPEAASELAKEVLLVFIGCRVRAFYAALGGDKPWPATWIADIRDAYTVIMAHPRCTQAERMGYLDWLDAVEARGAQRRVLRAALAKDPASAKLHERLRKVLLRDAGASALEAACDSLTATDGQRPTVDWFSGLASLLAAERHVTNEAHDEALASYARSLGRFRASIKGNANFAGSANHYVCLAAAGRARLLANEGAYEQAAKAVSTGIEAAPKSAATKDGLGNTPAQTARMLVDLLREDDLADEATRLEALLNKHGVR